MIADLTKRKKKKRMNNNGKRVVEYTWDATSATGGRG